MSMIVLVAKANVRRPNMKRITWTGIICMFSDDRSVNRMSDAPVL